MTPRAAHLLPILLAGCDATAPSTHTEPSPEGFDELYDAGSTRFLDAIEPRLQAEADGVLTFGFDANAGPACLDGGPYNVTARDAGGADLIIYLQPGGACWSETCLSISAVFPGLPPIDIVDAANPLNPLADWNVVYGPYCDGSLFAGDAEDPERGRTFAGLANLSAVIATARERFPNPSRVLFAGSSAGGYGTIHGMPLVRAAFPEAPIYILNDSGGGIARDADPGFLDLLLDEWNATGLVPASCEGCLSEGHLTPLIDWQLQRDPLLRVGVFGSTADYVISNLFLRVDGESGYGEPLLAQTAAVHRVHPSRFQRFIISGQQHTSLVGDVAAVIGAEASELSVLFAGLEIGGLDTEAEDGTTMADWVDALVNQGPEWTSKLPAGRQ